MRVPNKRGWDVLYTRPLEVIFFIFYYMATVYSSIGFSVRCRIDERGYPLIFKADIPNHGGRTSLNSKLDKV